MAGTSSANWREQVPGVGVDGEDRILDVLGLAGDLLLELRVAHDLCVGFHFGGDLLLLGRGIAVLE